MNFLSWLAGLLLRMTTRRGPMPLTMSEPAESPDLASIVDLISPHVPPPQRLVNELEARLRAMEVEEEGQWPGLAIPIPRRALGVGISALIALAVVGALFALYALRPREAQASPLQRAYTSLLSLESLSYRVQGQISPGTCAILFNAPLTPEERESLRQTTGSDSAAGNVISCQEGAKVLTEEGSYDLNRKAFKARVERKTIGQNLTPDVSAALAQPQERVFVNNSLYVKEGSRPWKVQEGDAAWAPFVVDGFGQIPSGRLGDVLAKQYDGVETLADTVINGEKLKHFRAMRTSPDTGVTDTAEVWVGDDGVLRKAVISLRTPFSIDNYLAPSLNAWRRGFEDPSSPSYPYRNLPFVKRGEFDARTIQWTFEFSDFNEPVEIEAPNVVQEGSGR